MGTKNIMQVLFFNFEFPPIGGGGANANAYLFREFSRMPELQIDCITSSEGQRDETISFSDNITLHRLNINKKTLHFWTQREVLSWLRRAHGKAGELMAHREYDLSHSFFGFPSGMLSWLRRSHLPYLVSLRGSDVPGFNPRFSGQYILLKPLFRRIWRRARFVLVNSAGLHRLADSFAPEIDIRVIPNGIDAGEFCPSDPDEREPQHLLCVSRLIGRKGVQHLIEAMPRVLASVPGARLTLVGEGDLEPQLRTRVRELGLGEKIHLLGHVPHDALPALYRRTGIFVQPSFYEGMSNTVLEAMACGLPIVTTAEGGREELFDGNAVFAEYGDLASLVENLVALLQNPAETERMGFRSREIALRFSWGRVADQYLQLYCRTASEGLHLQDSG